ncbi:hypothetical protein QEH59_07025 [Coraliomargarita sp. SDUM461004]|uniref:Uncharacterized protein n=1 Tax=Thalassobacterium sedimentorum TaxID=3041258 RepID=A0ABU1AK07_9BACT|nr:hypothetical protein [Coraliomargarita sp. SDUM461004]MDQ8194170.1 hypothetical protein [Coraliomargarita sp. SDUM461004]
MESIETKLCIDSANSDRKGRLIRSGDEWAQILAEASEMPRMQTKTLSPTQQTMHAPDPSEVAKYLVGHFRPKRRLAN